jgi:hypothetical protein
MKVKHIHELTADIENKLNEWLADNPVEVINISMSTHVVPTEHNPPMYMPWTNVLIVYQEQESGSKMISNEEAGKRLGLPDIGSVPDGWSSQKGNPIADTGPATFEQTRKLMEMTDEEAQAYQDELLNRKE